TATAAFCRRCCARCRKPAEPAAIKKKENGRNRGGSPFFCPFCLLSVLQQAASAHQPPHPRRRFLQQPGVAFHHIRREPAARTGHGQGGGQLAVTANDRHRHGRDARFPLFETGGEPFPAHLLHLREKSIRLEAFRPVSPRPPFLD